MVRIDIIGDGPTALRATGSVVKQYSPLMRRLAMAATIAFALAESGCGSTQTKGPATANDTSHPEASAATGGGDESAQAAPKKKKKKSGKRAKVGTTEEGTASYYADSLAGNPTASGEPYDPKELTAAHRTLPFGTLVVVTRDDGQSIQVRINDRGPFGKKKRIIDLSRKAAEAIGMIRAGVVQVTIKVVGHEDDS